MSDVTTGASPSLEASAKAIEGLLSASAETEETTTTQPEQVPEKKETEPEQVPAAPEPSESEQAEEKPEAEPEPPPKYKAKVDGAEVEVTLDDLLKSFSFTEHNTRKSQELAAQKKAFEESEVAAVRAERQQYAEYLAQLKSAIEQNTRTEPDWVKLRAEVSPDVFAAELLDWQQREKQREQIGQEQSRVKAQQDADAAQGFATYIQQQQTALEESIPEFKVPETAKALKSELREFGMSQYGFSDAEFSQVTDARLVRLLHDARQFHKAKAASPVIQNKIEKVMETSKPGARTTAPKSDAVAAAKARLKETGHVDDAGAAIAAMFKAS